MKYHKNVFTNFKVDITTPMCYSSIFTSDMTMISHVLIKINLLQIQEILDLSNSSFCSVFIKIFLHHLSTITNTLKIHLINLKTAFLSLYDTTSLLNLLSIQTAL